MVKQTIKLLFIILILSFVACDSLGDIFDEDLPEIDGGLQVSRSKVYPQDTINASVNATNPIDGDLDYEWTKSGGRFLYQSDPSTIKWISPNESGKYTLTIKVTNENGSSDASKEIEVLLPQQPVLNGNIVLSAESVTALDTITASISATNPRTGPLYYSWTCTGGRYVGTADNDTVRWIAPLSGGMKTLTVVVSNGLSEVQTSKQVQVLSSVAPIVHITAPKNNTLCYLGGQIEVSAEAAHENGVSLVRLYAQTPGGIDSLIQTLGTSVDGKYHFSEFKIYANLVGNATIKVEAEAANPQQTKGSDQITIKVLGIHEGRNDRQ